jgi:cell division protein FtsW
MNEAATMENTGRIRFGGLEYRTWCLTALLLAIGLLMAFDLGYSPLSGDTYSAYLLSIVKFVVLIGVGLFFANNLRKVSPNWLYFASHILIFAAILLLIYTARFGIVQNHARRWISLWGMTFQTSEFFKFALVIGLASALVPIKNIPIRKFWKIFLAVLFWIELGVGILLVFLQPNHSAAVIIAGTVLIITLFSKIKWQYIVSAGIVVLICLGVLIMRDTEKRNRIWAWITRSQPKQTITYSDERFQAEQALKAEKSAGAFGKGWNNSTIKQSLPVASSDFVFAIIVEETGFVGGLILLGLYMALFLAAFEAISNESNEFLKLMGLGLILIMIFNVMLHVAVNLDLVPTTGVPLPFVSQGGSALLMNLLSMGLILNIARRRDAEKLLS